MTIHVNLAFIRAALKTIQRYFHRWSIQAIWYLVSLGIGICLSAEETDSKSNPSDADQQTQKSQSAGDLEDKDGPLEQGLTLDQILNSKPDSSDYRSTENCIDRRRIRSYDALNDRLIVFKMRNGDRYLVLLKSLCHGLEAGKNLRMDTHGTLKICRGDTLRAVTSDFNRDAWGPPCLIPGFEPITKQQLDQLEVGVKSGRVN